MKTVPFIGIYGVRHLFEFKELSVADSVRGTKAVDEYGKPIRLYHGTRFRFNRFDMAHFGNTDDGFYGRGFYFSPDKDTAAEYGPRIVEVMLNVRNPFKMVYWNVVGAPEEIELREQLSGLKGIPKDIKPVTTLPKGYRVQREERVFNYEFVVYWVSPEPSLYGTEREIYGPEVQVQKKYDKEAKGELQAIVAFNDMVNGTSRYNKGLPSWVLQEIGRDDFCDLLDKNGYDALFVGTETPAMEYVVWDPEKIIIVNG
jgi:hypothetical protein